MNHVQAAKNKGEIPLAADVYERTHGVEMVDGEILLIGNRPHKIMVSGLFRIYLVREYSSFAISIFMSDCLDYV